MGQKCRTSLFNRIKLGISKSK